MAKQEKKNRLTSAPIPKLIKEIAVPAGIGFFFHTMYNVVDTYYAGLISAEAVAALTLSFPIFFIMVAMSNGIAAGATALIANALGAGDKRKARLYAFQAIAYAIIVGAVLMVVGFLIAPSLLGILGASGTYLDMALGYLNIIFGSGIFFLLNPVVNAPLTARGNTKIYRNYLILGFFLNVILDPWFVYGGLGLPAMGVNGVAWATALITVVGTLYVFLKARQMNLLQNISWKKLRPKRDIFSEITEQGLPASINMMTIALGIFVITYFISKFGQEAVAAYGISTRIDQIALLPTVGINMAALTLVGQNFGAGKLKRVKEALKKTGKYSLLIISLGMLGVWFFTPWLVGIFAKDEEVINIGVHYLRISAGAYWGYALIALVGSGLQGLKRPGFVMFLGLARQIGVPLILFWLLVHVWGLGLISIWWGIFGMVWISALASLGFLRLTLKRISSTKNKEERVK